MPQTKEKKEKITEDKINEKLDALLKSSGDVFTDRRRDAVLSIQGLYRKIPDYRRKGVIERLLKLSSDKNENVRYASLETLKNFINILPDDSDEILSGILKRIIAASYDKSTDIRKFAIRTIGVLAASLEILFMMNREIMEQFNII